MNKLIKREFLPVGEESRSYTTAAGDTKIATTIRKRWYATMECCECTNTFTVLERKDNKHITTPCEKCKARIGAYKSFLKKAVEKHKDKFDYSLITKDNYVNLFTPVSIICKTHGEFTQKPNDHTSKVNGKLCCPSCIQEFNKLHNKRSIESWKDELAEKTPHITFVSHGNSDSNTEKCVLTCEHHGEFETTLASIKNNVYICHKCALEVNSWNSRTERIDIKGTLYFIYIPDIEHFKLGVTTTSIKDRFSSLPYKYETIWNYEFDTAKEAYQIESILFRKYKEYRPYSNYVYPKNFERFGGYTELLTCEIPFTAIQCSNALSKEP